MPNAGNLMIRPTATSHRLMDDWVTKGLDPAIAGNASAPAAAAGGGKLLFRKDMADQEGLQKLVNQSWTACASTKSCSGALLLPSIVILLYVLCWITR